MLYYLLIPASSALLILDFYEWYLLLLVSILCYSSYGACINTSTVLL